MAGSGYAEYANAHDSKYGTPFQVPIQKATAKTIADYGTIVKDFDKEDVKIVTWPQQGWRPICPGTGNQAAVALGNFVYNWEGDVLRATNTSVKIGGMSGKTGIIGRLPLGVSASNKTSILTREANYHPDGGQVFFPRGIIPYVLLLALPGDDIKLEDFVAFYCDGTFGVQIKPCIWHQPAFPVDDQNNASFLGKQNSVYTCVRVDTVEEFGRFLKVPIAIQ